MDIANAVVAKPIKYLFRRAGAELVYNKLVAPYFAQKSPRRAIAGLVALNAATLGGGVAFNYLGRDIINSFATKDFSSFSRNMVRFGIFSVGMIAVNVAQSHIANRLRLSWGNWAKERAIREWLSPGNRAGSSAAKAELQPEQRITNDISNLVQASEPLTFGLAQNAANFGAFSLVLFNLSPAVYAGTLAVGAIGTWALHRAGKKLTALNHQEAETQNAYRNAVGDANTHTESIALWGGEAATQQSILARLEDANAVSKKIIGTQAALTAIRSAYNHVASVAPHLLIAPAYFKPESTMNVGDAMLSTSATFNVRNSLDWYSQNQNTIVQWKACAKRLTAFLQGCDPSSGPAGQTPSYDPEGPLGLSVKNLALKKPGGSGLLCRDISFDLKPGNRLVVLGESGAGKSTLFRTLRGISPYENGQIAYSGASDKVGDIIFVPQDPYIPDMPLAQVLSYPNSGAVFSEPSMRNALEKVGLGHKAEYLGQSHIMGNALGFSGGEKQRLNFARLLLHKPSVIGLDEATSALPSDDGIKLHELLFRELPRSIVISIAHREELIPLHNITGRMTQEKLSVHPYAPLRPSESGVRKMPEKGIALTA